MSSVGTDKGAPDAVGVVVVTYSPAETLDRFLDTLGHATTRPVEIVVADNGSTDGSPQRAATRRNVALIRTGSNVGYGAAANRGVAALSDAVGWVIIANPDVEWAPGAVDELLAATKRWESAGSLGPMIMEPDGSLYPSARRLPSIPMGIGHAVFGWIWPSNPWTAGYRQDGVEPTERAAEWLSGSCLLVRRSAFEAVGGFDERYFMYFEDVDLGDRLSQQGWLNVYVPTASVTHHQGFSTSRQARKMLAAHHASAYRYLADRHPRWFWRPLLVLLRAGLCVRLRLALRKMPPDACD